MDEGVEHHAEALRLRRTAALVDFALLAGLVTVVVITCVVSFGFNIGSRFQAIADAL